MTFIHFFLKNRKKRWKTLKNVGKWRFFHARVLILTFLSGAMCCSMKSQGARNTFVRKSKTPYDCKFTKKLHVQHLNKRYVQKTFQVNGKGFDAHKIWRYWPCVVFANFDVEQTPSSCLDALFLSGFVSLIVMRLLRQISLPYFLKKVPKSRFCGFEIGLSRGSVNRKS